MRRAVIDIGTNTVKLLVADVSGSKVVPVAAKDRTTRLGQAVDRSRKFLPTAMARTIQAIQDYLAEAKGLGATDFRALATSAARDAVNRDEFFGQVQREYGLKVELISGEREAELIYRGVCSDPEWSSQSVLVVDVGGGSAEFVQGHAGRMERFQSLPLGALRLTEKFGDERFAELLKYLRATLRDALVGYDARQRRLIATGGTIATLGSVCRSAGSAGVVSSRQAERLPCNTIDHWQLSREYVQLLVDQLRAMPQAKRREVPGLPPERADIIVAGGAVIAVAMEVLEADKLTVSIRNLRYGALIAD
jgi:exopolyphosphatase/guanosine-5'-triphosphate,3'-diphosphate pyrophosphatase